MYIIAAQLAIPNHQPHPVDGSKPPQTDLIVERLPEEVELRRQLLPRHRRLLLVDHGVAQGRRALVQPHAVPRTEVL